MLQALSKVLLVLEASLVATPVNTIAKRKPPSYQLKEERNIRSQPDTQRREHSVNGWANRFLMDGADSS